MINISEIRNNFRKRIKDSAIFESGSIAYENKSFNPVGKTIWMKENYLPSVEESATSEGDVVSGIFQYSIFTPIDSGDSLAVSSGVALGNLWQTQEAITTDNYTISIDSTTCSFQGSLDNIWYSYIVDVTFKAYE